MWDILYYLFVVVVFAGLIVGATWAARMFVPGYLPMTNLFGGTAPERRVDVIEQTNVDGKRRLLLIRRDDVEHLIMTGGPVDMVIESNIGPARRSGGEIAELPTAYSRPARRLGTAVGEQ